ncbi:AAA family ATPase [Streptomyces sp. NPDC002082]|uniref:AAA family ATPase n=1 Tax=Streptomyces sp. NPDC002082 TaxID=3154772 RepID=UPI00331C2FDB
MTGNATNVSSSARAPLLAAAKRHNMLPIAVMVPTPGTVCVERQGPRPANRTVPKDVVLQQYRDMVSSHISLASEGLAEVIMADSLSRLLPYLKHLAEKRITELGLDGGVGLGDLLLVRRTFGEEILPLWSWLDSDIADGDRVGEVRLGQRRLVLALRTDVDGEGDIGFDILVPCPHNNQCTARAWAPAYSVISLFRALNGDLDDDEDSVCTLHGPKTLVSQDDDALEEAR